MDDTVIIENDPDLPNGWVSFVTANEDNIHPYGLIFSKIQCQVLWWFFCYWFKFKTWQVKAVEVQIGMVQLSGRYQGRVTPPVTVASIEQYLIITGWPWPWSCCTSLSSLSVTDSIPSSPRQSEYSCLSCPVTSSIASSCCLSWGSGFKQSVKEGPIFLHYTCKNVVVFQTA